MNIKYVYFVGIGGIGMSNLARYFYHQKKQVAGYDKTPSEITTALEHMGIPIFYDDAPAYIPKRFQNKNETLIVYTPAIPKTHRGLQYFQNSGFTLLKRATVLGKITKDTLCLAVAGTHGKTTTSAILGHIMKQCATGATSFLGGILQGYDSNLLLGDKPISVVEADEFDRSFLQLHPDIACINNTDADHLDIYQTPDALSEAFKLFANKVSQKLFVAKGIDIEGMTYAVEDVMADYYIHNVRILEGSSVFDVHTPTENATDVIFHLPGKHNLSNALAAMAMAQEYGLPLEKITSALATFKGVQRRFNYRIKNTQRVLIDDYAHHPTEINAVAQTLGDYYPDDEWLVVFQPHLFTRTLDFADDFAESLARFDSVLLLDIYPARELPLEGVTSDWLLEKIPLKKKSKITESQLIPALKKATQRVIVMLGAGDIGVMVGAVESALTIN